MSQEQDNRSNISEWLARMHARPVSPEVLRRREEFYSLRDKLGEDGFKMIIVGTAAPVQFSGYLPDGEPFYFKARGDAVSLAVGKAGEEPFDERGVSKDFDWVVWEREASAEGRLYAGAWDFTASWLEASEAERHLRELHQQYLNGAPSQFTS